MLREGGNRFAKRLSPLSRSPPFPKLSLGKGIFFGGDFGGDAPGAPCGQARRWIACIFLIMLIPEGLNGAKPLALWTPSGILLLGFTISFRWCYFQRAFRSPSGLLRRPFGWSCFIVKVKLSTFITHNLTKGCTRRVPRGDRKAPWKKLTLISCKEVAPLHQFKKKVLQGEKPCKTFTDIQTCPSPHRTDP